MKIQVLGSGCPTCHKLYDLVQTIVTETGQGDSVEYITGDQAMQQIVALGAMGSPVVVVNGKVVMVGYVPDKKKVKAKIYGTL